MKMTSFTRKRGQTLQMTEAERERLAAKSTLAIEKAARDDPDNPPLAEEQLRRMAAARFVRRTRERTGLNQAEFASRYGLSLGRLRDYEQGRFVPDVAALAYLQLISENPERARLFVELLPGEPQAALTSEQGMERGIRMQHGLKNARAGRPAAENAGRMETLAGLAEETLAYFEDAVAGAEAELAASKGPTPDSIASLNTFTSRAFQNLAAVSDDARRNLEAVIAQPAIARLEVLNDDGEPETIFITPGGAPHARWGDVRVASYRSPVGRLAALPVGGDLEVQTPNGEKHFELLARARLNPERGTGGWDSHDTVVERLSATPLTVLSLRALLRAPVSDDEALALLHSILQQGNQEQNVFEGLRRSVLHRMGLRERPLLDQFQDEVFRLPLRSQVTLLGPPGSGKTTTLIKRLGLKLDLQALDDDDLAVVDRTYAGRRQHAVNWLMFSPTELLRQYVKEAFNRERVPASDRQIQTWDTFRKETSKYTLGILRSGNSSRGGVLREQLDNLLPNTLEEQTKWFDDFDAWQRGAFWKELEEHVQRIAQVKEPGIGALSARLARIVEVGSVRDGAEPFVEFRALSREVAERAAGLQSDMDRRLASAFAQELQSDRELLTRLVAFLATLGDSADAAEDLDDAEDDDD